MSRDLDVALEAAAAGAAELSRHYRSSGVRDTAESKGERRNLVTAADRAAENLVLEVLARECPDDGVVVEETQGRERFAGGQRSVLQNSAL